MASISYASRSPLIQGTEQASKESASYSFANPEVSTASAQKYTLIRNEAFAAINAGKSFPNATMTLISKCCKIEGLKGVVKGQIEAIYKARTLATLENALLPLDGICGYQPVKSLISKYPTSHSQEVIAAYIAERKRIYSGLQAGISIEVLSKQIASNFKANPLFVNFDKDDYFKNHFVRATDLQGLTAAIKLADREFGLLEIPLVSPILSAKDHYRQSFLKACLLIDRGDVKGAASSFVTDLEKHPTTAQISFLSAHILSFRDGEELKKFISGIVVKD
jgi:hypothetical protein